MPLIQNPDGSWADIPNGAAPTTEPYTPPDVSPYPGGAAPTTDPATYVPGAPFAGGQAPVYTPAPAVAPTAATQAIFDSIRTILDRAGLSGLYGIDASGNPSGWVWDQIVANKGAAGILLDMEQTAPFQQKFGIITQLREQATKQPGIHVPTPGEVLSYRETVSATMRAADLPSWFYDEQSDFDSLMLKGLSAAAIEEHLGESWQRVQKAPPEVRTAFQDFYGVAAGDSALAAFFLDPAHTTAKLGVATRAAYTAGKGSTLGITVGMETAEAIAKMGLSDEQISAGLSQVAGMSSLYRSSIGESGGPELTTGTGLDAVFGGNADATAALSRRRLERQAVDRTTGGALTTGAGVLGVGS